MKAEYLVRIAINSANLNLFRRQSKSQLGLVLKIALLFCSSAAFAQQENEINLNARYFEYQQAAMFSHLQWPESLTKISVNLLPIKNYSGIPIEQRDERPEYFYHGKLPLAMNNIFRDATLASRYFVPTNNKADYQMELILDSYQLPFQYAPDDQWWKKLHGQADRWLQTPKNASITMTIKITSGNKKIKPWMEKVQMMLSNCDLNTLPQPQSWMNNRDQITQNYLSTTPGQTFLAAANFLILKSINRIHQQPLLGQIKHKHGSTLHLISNETNFTMGETLKVYYQDADNGKSGLSAGTIKVINTDRNHAIAYPVTLRADHLKVGDWVELKSPAPYSKPLSKFRSASQCAEVVVAEVADANEG
ncbi:hypothetical protein FLL46_25010 [Aliikangiella coralliicola]|uniref:Uncharacterized protein n=2 Tax=Aliikangiella coralliicola TaxID=2592383 RepID=A0A545TW19_9GAMM|nr:hypothetical protein FLL46_25010 [Aliikangiella coralliicola]